MNERELLQHYTEWLHKQDVISVGSGWEFPFGDERYTHQEMIDAYLSEQPKPNVHKIIREQGTG